jgi:hypothetical protein
VEIQLFHVQRKKAFIKLTVASHVQYLVKVERLKNEIRSSVGMDFSPYVLLFRFRPSTDPNQNQTRFTVYWLRSRILPLLFSWHYRYFSSPTSFNRTRPLPYHFSVYLEEILSTLKRKAGMILRNVYVNAFPLQTWPDPWSSWRLRLQNF